MKCPIFCIGDYEDANIKRNPSFDCIKEECAWWLAERGSCSVFVIARELENLRVKVPFASQFPI